MADFRIFAAGAAKGYVETLVSRFEEASHLTATRAYGPVGAIVERLRSGESADLVILSDKALAELAATGITAPGAWPIGGVTACLAVRAGDPLPPLATAEDLRAAFLAADAVHMPDPAVATSGAHLMGIFRSLGLTDEIAGRLRFAANGIAAMTEMSRSEAARAIGCTQESEIAMVDGVRMAGPLPEPFALTTVYAAAWTPGTAHRRAAEDFIALLTGDETASRREVMGFRPA